MVDEARVRRWVCLDVGETLIDETRVWSTWADVLGVPRPALFAAFRDVVGRGSDHRDVLEQFAGPSWRDRIEEVEAIYGGFRREDLYPDALPAIASLRAAGYRVAVLANQPASRADELEAIGVRADVLAMSEALGLHKPDPAFFARALELMGDPPPGDVAYVGDRIDNDVGPARAAGMRTVWIRRGPWGEEHEERVGEDLDGAADLVVRSLDELVERIGEVWE
jgi:HAD superfamily hydrolase (TIGR01662 family)